MSTHASKFVAGDRFKVIENGNEGTIVGVTEAYVPNYSKSYTAVFDGLPNNPGRFDYKLAEAAWQHINIPPVTWTPTVVVPYDHRSIEFDPSHWDDDKKASDLTHTIECVHDFTTYHGLSEVYKFCTKCDKKVYT